MYTSTEILQKVNEHLAALTYDRKPATLYEPIRYVLSMGGKRIRPVLMLMAYNLYKDDVETIMSSAIGLETYHNYTLLHDDLMDNSDLRRGFPTVHKRWDANTAILSGDTMMMLAMQRMMENRHRLEEVLDVFVETTLQVGEGQQYDMDFEQRNDVAEDEYVEMIRLKTSVLLACGLKMGAILADAPAEDVDNLYRFGEHIGLAFQLQDDYLDVYGDPKVFKKKIGGDIVSNKKTYMLINAFNRANEQQRKELTRWVEAKDFDRQEKIDAVTRLYDDIGIKQLSEAKVKHYFDESRKFLSAVSVADERKTALRSFAESLMDRKY